MFRINDTIGTLGVVAAVVCVVGLADAREISAQTADTETVEVSIFLVQTSSSMTFDGETLVLELDETPTAWFSDRPNRLYGTFPSAHLAEIWADGADSYAAVPPNAVLVVAGFEPAVLELAEFRMQNGAYSFAVIPLSEGEIPTEGGETTLVIDGVGVDLPNCCISSINTNCPYQCNITP